MFRPMPRYGQQLELKKGICTPIHTIVQMPFCILITDIYKNAVEFGIKLAETGPELELNEQVQAQWKRFETRRHKRRRCYVKAIEQ